MTNTGFHLILDCKRIHKKLSLDNMISLLDNICSTFQFTVLERVKHTFGDDPFAYTVLYLLSESHISVHTYFEYDYVAIDIYTCSKTTTEEDYKKIAHLFGRYMSCSPEYKIIQRKTD